MPPKLLISDTSISPPITTEYNHGENVLDFKTIYTSIKQLPKHSGKGILITYTNPLSPLPLSLLRPCSKEFLDTYWALFAHIIDYFADFASEDSMTMQSLWFHLLDVLESVAKGLPHEFWMESTSGQATVSCEHAKEFAEQYSQTMVFLHEVINARTVRNSVPILHSTLRTHEPPTSYPGAFKAGLNPWQQFLLNGAPGFEVPKSARKYRDDDPFEKYPHGRRIVREHQVPFGALGIVAKHIGRLRHAAIEIASDGAELRSSAETLDEFDSHVLKPGHTFAYTSISGRRTVVQHMHPLSTHSLTPTRVPGYGDPACEADDPNLYLLDECVAIHKGKEAFVHPRGVDDFQMWSVSVLKEQEGEQRGDDAVRRVLGDLGDLKMFGDWKVGRK